MHLLITRPQHLVLCVSAHARLPVVLPARDLHRLHQHLPLAIGAILKQLQVDQAAIAQELAAMATFQLARTISRSLLGTLNDFANLLWSPVQIPACDLHHLSLELSKTPVGPLKYESPRVVARRLFGISVG